MSYKDFENLQFNNLSIKKILETIFEIKNISSPILITGNRGTGKTSLAKYILLNDHLKNSHIITFDFEFENYSENFKLNFKKAIEQQNPILFENIDRLSMVQQLDFYNFLVNNRSQTKLVFTSRKNIYNMVVQSVFSADLYYYISVINFNLPDLIYRPTDMPILVDYYVQLYTTLHFKNIKGIDENAANKIFNWNWPGNLRELEAVIERAVILSESIIEDKSIIFDKAIDCPGISVGKSLSEVEKELILQTLEVTSQNKSKAAHILGISIRTLRNKLNEYKIQGGSLESCI